MAVPTVESIEYFVCEVIIDHCYVLTLVGPCILDSGVRKTNLVSRFKCLKVNQGNDYSLRPALMPQGLNSLLISDLESVGRCPFEVSFF